MESRAQVYFATPSVLPCFSLYYISSLFTFATPPYHKFIIVEENRDAYNIVDCISLSLGAEYIGVHDLEGIRVYLGYLYNR